MNTKNQRGASFSTFIVVLVPVLLFAAGLAIDGSAQAAGNRHAESVAAQAARSGLDASAGARVYGVRADHTAIQAAQERLAEYPELTSSVTVDEQGRLRVETTGRVSTVLLSLGGVSELPTKGSAEVDITAG